MRCGLAVLLALLLTDDGVDDDSYRPCWCLKEGHTWTCRSQLVVRTCWEVPLCRPPLKASQQETECWRRSQIGKQIRQLSGNSG